MFFDKKITVSDLTVFFPKYQKKKSVFVPGRPFHALTYRLSGKITIENEYKNLTSSIGDITFVPKGMPYHTEILESGSMYVVHFNTYEDYTDLCHEIIKPENPLLFRNKFSELSSRFKLGLENDLYCMSMFYGILAEARREARKISNTHAINPKVRIAKDYIDRHFSDSTISVSMLAEYTGISEVYFRKLFLENFGVSPNAYIKHIRIENAKAYLSTGYYTITETATRCGFDSISYFSYEFRRVVGITPREYASKFT